MHVKGIELSSDYEDNQVWIGGIAGRTVSNQIEIRNSSVTNFKVEQDKEISGITLGGILGEAYREIQIENCYAQNIDFNISKAQRYNGIGGIVGNAAYGGSLTYQSIRNCYSTGSINASGEYIGGIAGKNKAAISNCYSLVNIMSSSVYLGGIIGEDTSTASTALQQNVLNNISIGNVYSRSNDEEYVNRIFGSANNTIISNYAYKDQLINGELTEEAQLATLFTREELLQEKTYTNIGFGKTWDYSKLSESILPKLYNTNGTELLPNQEDNKLEEQADIRVDSIEANKKDVNHAEIRLVINNPTEENITNIEIDSMNVEIERNVTQSGKTYIDILGTPTGYYDSYQITALVYEQNGEEKKTIEEKKIELQFFKDIGKIEDWQEIDSDSAQNYRLVSDLDFFNVREPNTNVSIGRLVSEGEGHTIKNLETTDKTFIKEAKLEIRNITFENINVTNNKSYVGIIGENNAQLENLSFKDCKVKSTGSYIGIISNNTSKNISKINLKNINCQGDSMIGGFIANTNDGKFTNIKADNVTVFANGNYVGGIFGYVDILDQSKETDMRNLEVTNSNIFSYSNDVGGISGQGRAASSRVTNTKINGYVNVGGMIGYNTEAQSWTTSDDGNVCENVTVNGYSSVGGIYGFSNSCLENVFLIDSEVIATNDTVGGLIGWSSASIRESGVINSKISGNNRVGGLIGYNDTNAGIYTNFIEGTTIEGYDNVGGIEGYRRVGGQILYIYVNAKITAINGAVGGITGYYENLNSTQANNSGLNQIMLQNSEITGTESVGGIIGKLDKEYVFKDSVTYQSYYLDVRLNGNNTDTISLGFGNFDSQTDDLKDLFTYKYSSINGQYIENVKDLNENQIVTGEQLKEQKTYTDRGFSTSIYDFSRLKENKYPTLLGIENQNGIDLPQDPEESGISLFSNELTEELSEDNNSNNENLPSMTAYSVDVDKINIDFNNLLEGTYFTYTVNGKKSDNITLESKTYTFEFDFESPIEIEIVNGENIKTVTINPDDVRRNTSYVGDNLMYLDGNTIIMNGNTVSGEYVNLYKGKGLTTEGKVIDIVSGKEESSISGISLVDTKAISEYSYNGTEIRTFGTYSLVGDKVRNQIYEVKDGKLSVISSNVQRKIGDNVIDFYNENEYQTILASDGILYDLKEKLEYPSNFENSNIEEISVESDKKEILVYYKNGSIIIFNYMTGEEIYKTSPKEKVSLFAYIGEKLSKPDELYNDLTDEYKQSKELEEKLIEEPIELYLGSDDASNNEIKTESSNASSRSESYVTVYNADAEKYEVYKESELLDSNVDNPESETSKIEKVKGLQDYYYSGNKTIEKDNGLIYIGISIVALGISIIILHRLVIIKNIKKGKLKRNKK